MDGAFPLLFPSRTPSHPGSKDRCACRHKIKCAADLSVAFLSHLCSCSSRGGTSTAQHPVSNGPSGVKVTLRRSKEDTKRLVDEILDANSDNRKEYLMEKVLWEAPTAVKQIGAFINDLEIPQLLESPALLLNSPGNGVVNPESVRTSLTTESKYRLLLAIRVSSCKIGKTCT